MHETRHQVTQRKIRNGLRKQAEKIWNEKMKVWEILKRDTTKKAFEVDAGYFYCPYIPIMGNVSFGIEPVRGKFGIVSMDTTA